MRNNLFLISLVNICLSSSCYAMSTDEFNNLEYHVNAGVGNTLPYDADTLTADFKQKFDFIKFDDEPSLKLVTFIDTPDRTFKKSDLSIRVREHVSNPRKSKITVKFRAPDPASFNLTGYTKAETDYTDGRPAYSVSYDVPYSPADLDVKKVDFDKLAKLLKKDDKVWELIGKLYNDNKQNLNQTTVMRTRDWDGKFVDKQFNNIEVNFQSWTPFYRQPRVTYTEFSFKGNLKNKSELEKANAQLVEKVNATGLGKGFEGSKTEGTFDLSKAFN